MRKILFAFLLLSVLVASSSQIMMSEAQSGDLTGILATKYDPNIPLEKFQATNVRWVIFYWGFTSALASKVHSLGMKAMVYVTALKEPGSARNGITLPDGTKVNPSQSWAQYVPSTGSYMYPDPSAAAELWFSPYGPYIDKVTIPRIKQNLQLGADGIFLDTLILYGDNNGNKADDNPTYADPVWKTQYSGMTYQDFRYQSLHDAAKKIFTALKNQNPNAVLIISDNNVCVQPAATESQLRDKFASAIDRWQDGADAFVLEYVGLIENNNPSNPIGEAQAIINVWNREKSTYHVSKPMWVIGFTNRDDVFNYLKSNSATQGFGYWAYEQYLATHAPSGIIIPLPSSSLAQNPLGRVFFIFNNKKYYIANPYAFNSYGLNWADVKTTPNPDNYQSSPIKYDYLLDGKMPLPNKPYIAGDVNDGSLYYIPYYDWSGQKYPISAAGYNAYGGYLKTLPIRYGDPAVSLSSSSTVLDGVNQIPSATPPSYVIGKNPLGRIFFIFNNKKYYFTALSAYQGYGFKDADINLSVNPDSYLSAQVSFDYILEDTTSVFRKPLPNKPYIVGDVNDGSLYWVPYFTWTGLKYPITGAGLNGYSGQLKALSTRYGDPSINLQTGTYILDGVNPIPQVS